MALSNAVRGNRGIESVGRAVQAAVSRTDTQPPAPDTGPDEMLAATPSPVPPPAAANEGAQTSGFSLPDLGPSPDPNAPEYQGAEGQKRYADAQATYAHKQDIHQAFTDLEKTYAGLEPNRDYQKEYQDMVAQQQAHEAERPKGDALSRFALALGDYNPAVRQSGVSNLETYNKNVAEAGAQSDKSFAQRMVLRAKMHESAAADAEASGNWKKALKEQESLALLKADEDALKQRREMEKVGAQQSGANTRAVLRRDAAEKVANIRARAIGSAHGLSGGFLATFEEEAAKSVAKLLGPKDLTKEYGASDLDSITTYLEGIAEMLHDQQFGTQDSGAAYGNTHPGRRKAPAAKQKF